MSNLERSYNVALESLGNALERKIKKRRGILAASLFTVAIAQKLGVPREQIKVIANVTLTPSAVRFGMMYTAGAAIG